MQQRNITIILLILILIFTAFTAYMQLKKPEAKPVTPQNPIVSESDKASETPQTSTNKIEIKRVPMNKISFDDDILHFDIKEVTRYRPEKISASSVEVTISQADPSGKPESRTYNIPANKCLIAVKTAITNRGTYVETLPSYSVIQARYTNPALREKSIDTPAEPIEAATLSISPKQAYEYSYLFYADYYMDHVVLTYGKMKSELMVDFNVNN